MLEVIIRKFDEKDREEVFRLHHNTFISVDVEKTTCPQYLSPERALVAELDGRVIGFAAYLVATDSEKYRDEFQRLLDYSWDLREETIRLLESHLKSLQEEYGKGQIVINHFSNEFTKEGTAISDSDFLFMEIAVDPNFRHRGIGTELIKRRIEIARQRGASAIYVQCWQGGNVSGIYDKIGFLPIIEFSPAYPDGNAMKAMGYKLR